MKNFIYLLFTIFGIITGAKLPDGLTFCRKSDPNFENCFKDAINGGFKIFAKGFRPLGITQLEPMSIPEMKSDSSNGLSQTFNNIKIAGLSKSVVEKIEVDWDKLEMKATIVSPHSEMTADYKIKGNFLTFALDSAGKCKIEFDDITSFHTFRFERFQKNGKNHLRIIDWTIDIEPKSIHYDFENVIPGNEQLSKTIMETLNENAIQIYKDQASVFNEAYAALHKAVANRVYENVPEDELFLP